LGIGVTVARLTLDQLVKVQILDPQITTTPQTTVCGVFYLAEHTNDKNSNISQNISIEDCGAGSERALSEIIAGQITVRFILIRLHDLHDPESVEACRAGK
jgi:hypothetical protein